MCSSCPRAFGYAKSGDPRLASFSCRHRYTGRRICAIPCNGKDDLCLGDSDEERCEETVWSVFLGASACMLTLTLLACAVLVWSIGGGFAGGHQGKDLEMEAIDDSKAGTLGLLLSALLQEDLGQEDLARDLADLYRQFHEENEGFLTLFHHLDLALADEKSWTKARVFRRWHQLELQMHDMEELSADRCLKRRLETTAEAREFYNFAEASAVVLRIKSATYHFLLRLWTGAFGPVEKLRRCGKVARWLREFPESPASRWSLGTKSLLVAMVKILFCHADIVKDVLLVYALGTIISTDAPDFGQQVLGALIGSIMVAEFTNLATTTAFVLRKHELGMAGKTVVCLLSPLMPGIAMGMQSWYGFKMGLLKCPEAREEASNARLLVRWHEEHLGEQRKWQRAFAAYKQGEGSTEQFFQLLILVLLILVTLSESATMDGLQTIFAPRANLTFVLASSGISFLTLIRTMLQGYSSAKNHFLPLLGKLLLTTSFIVGATSRLAAAVLYFAPSLGLFGLSMHWKMGSVGFNPDNVYEYRRSSGSEAHVPVHVSERWIPSTDYTDYTVWSFQVHAMVFLVLCTLHPALVFAAKTLCSCKFRRDPLGLPKVLHVIHNGVAFIPYSEWDDDDDDGDDGLDGGRSFRVSWSRNLLESVAVTLLLAVENAFLCGVPLWVLMARIGLRNRYLMEYFPPLHEERASAERTWLLATVAPVLLLVVSPALQLALARLHYACGHPWARIFREEMKRRRPAEDGRRDMEKEEEEEEEEADSPEQEQSGSGDGSGPDENGSTRKENGTARKKTGSSPDKGGSSSDENGSSPDENGSSPGESDSCINPDEKEEEEGDGEQEEGARESRESKEGIVDATATLEEDDDLQTRSHLH